MFNKRNNASQVVSASEARINNKLKRRKDSLMERINSRINELEEANDQNLRIRVQLLNIQNPEYLAFRIKDEVKKNKTINFKLFFY